VTDLARMIATKDVSPVEVVRAHLARIERLDGTLRAYITVCGDAALDAARAAEAALAAGQPLGPLHGVPIALKDLVDTRGVRTTGGSRILADRVPAADATVVTRLTGAGAIVRRVATVGRSMAASIPAAGGARQGRALQRGVGGPVVAGPPCTMTRT
jgi:aspartyl-tRNA(Asn)/glutamyl-tRNA(Gln) amidotransferase subunit A